MRKILINFGIVILINIELTSIFLINLSPTPFSIISVVFYIIIIYAAVKLTKKIKTRKIFLMFLIILLIPSIYTQTFDTIKYKYTKERWANNSKNRAWMLKDLLNKRDLTGMNKQQLINLIGQSNSDYSGFYIKQDENNELMIYRYFKDNCLFPYYQYLVVELKNNKVINFSTFVENRKEDK